MNPDTVICEQAAVEGADAAPILVTCVVFNEERSQLVEESHVFLPGRGLHLQTSRFRKLTDIARRESPDIGVQATRALLMRHLASSGTAAAEGFVHCDFERLVEAPFYRFKLARLFLQEMAEIQEWTASADLRLLLAEVLSYRCDHEESELLARLFTDYCVSRRDPHLGARGYLANPQFALRWHPRSGPQNER